MSNKSTSKSKSLVIKSLDEVLKRVANGEYLKDIASTLGIKRQAISFQLSGNPDYERAKEEGMRTRLDAASQLLEQVTLDETLGKENSVSKIPLSDSLSLARIRELGLKRIEWRASVEHPSKWGGTKVAININTNVPTSAALLEQEGEAKRLVALIQEPTTKPKGDT